MKTGKNALIASVGIVCAIIIVGTFFLARENIHLNPTTSTVVPTTITIITTTTKLPCLQEGQSGAIVPNVPGCCPGLTSISCNRPDSNNVCPDYPCLGVFFCTRCGNGICEPKENKCNCPQDCANVS